MISSIRISSFLLCKERKIYLLEFLQSETGSNILTTNETKLTFVFFCRLHTVSHTKEDHYLEKIRSDPFFKGVYGKPKGFAQYLNKPLNVTKIKICRDTFLMIPVVIYMRQDFYLVSAINKILLKIEPSGLIDFWESQDVAKDQHTKEVFRPKALGLGHFKGSFYILLIGWTLSIVGMMVEILIKNLETKRMNRKRQRVETKKWKPSKFPFIL
jgi:hypothetical protein